MNKLFILIILLFTALSCSNTHNFEGQIIFLEAGVITELNDSKEIIWAEDIDIDILLKLGKQKRVALIKIRDENNLTKSFHVDPNISLEKINLAYTYSHIQSHMLTGNKLKIEYVKSKYKGESNNKVIDLEFIDHEH